MTKYSSSDNDRNSSPGTAGPSSEGSPLYSLNALKAKAEAAVKASKPQSRDENSGLIDLKLMMAQAEQEKAAEALKVAPHLPVYPFGTPVEATSQPQPAPVADPTSRRRSKRGRAASVGIAAALLGVAAVAAAAVSAGLGPFKVPQTALTTPIPTALQWSAPPATAPAATEKNEVANAQPSQAEEADRAIETPRQPKEIPHIAKAPVLNKKAQAPAETPPATPPKPANDPCNGDLMCAMQRAVKK